jgi:hypothetical protein
VREEARFVLFLWRDGTGAGAWRASLTDVRTRVVRRFGGMAALQAFLDERTTRHHDVSEPRPHGQGAYDADDDA